MGERPGYVYLMRLNERTKPVECAHKIGRTTDLMARHKMIHVKMPYSVTLVAAIATTGFAELEVFFHDFLKSHHLNGEWFRLPERSILMFCAVALGLERIDESPLISELAHGKTDWYAVEKMWKQAALASLYNDDDDDLPF